MRTPRGFDKRYFSLSSILAYAVAPKLHSAAIIYKTHINFNFSNEEEAKEEDPPTLLQETLITLITNKPCHCDCVFRRKTRLAVTLFKFIPRCPFYCTFFAFRRTGTHPPLF